MVTGGGQWVQIYLISYIPVMKNPTLVSAPFGSVIPTFWLIFCNCYIIFPNCERSEPLVCSMAWIFAIYIFFFAGRTSCRKYSKYFYVYLNIRPMRYSFLCNANIKRATCKRNRLNELTKLPM